MIEFILVRPGYYNEKQGVKWASFDVIINTVNC